MARYANKFYGSEMYMESEKQYFTGVPCKRGHVSNRLKSTRACLECVRVNNVAWRKDNPNKMYASVKAWRLNNPDLVAAQTKRRYQDNSYRVGKRLSSQIRSTIAGTKNFRHWETLVGYTKDELKEHIEKQFLKGMTWANIDGWHIDHITPKVKFDMTNDEGIKGCWALSNLRPLWATDNCRKRDNITHLL